MQETVFGMMNVLIYFGTAAAVVLSIRRFTHVPDELFRKLLHFVLLGGLTVWTVSFTDWKLEIITVIGFVVIVYPILMFFERFSVYSRLVTERTHGELKSSLVIVFVMFAIVIAVTEGIFHDKYLTLASIYAWGFGDAAAALIGKRYGKHKITGKYLSGKKSVEGFLAMLVTSFASVAAVLWCRGGMTAGEIIPVSLCVSMVSAVFELYTPAGLDTITCPLASMAVLLLVL